MLWIDRLLRAVCRLLVGIASIVALVALVILNPLTRPTDIVSAGLEQGLASAGSVEIARFLTAESLDTEMTAQSDYASRIESVYIEAFAPSWVENTLNRGAAAAEEWITGESHPPIVIDLTGVKNSIAKHPDGYLVVLPLLEGADDPDSPGTAALEAWIAAGGDPNMSHQELLTEPEVGTWPETRAAVEVALKAVPDEVAWSGDEDWWVDLTKTAADLRRGSSTAGSIAFGVAMLVGALGVWRDPRHWPVAVASWMAGAAFWGGLVATAAWGVTWLASSIPIPAIARLGAATLSSLWGWIPGASLLGMSAIAWIVSRTVQRGTAVTYSVEPQLPELVGVSAG